jgi:hypothetical protein
MKKSFTIIAGIFSLLAITFIIMAQNDNEKERTAVAAQGLKNLVELSDAQTEKMAGIPLEKLRSATLGQPYSLSYINSAALQKADSVGTLDAYLLPAREYYYPVLSDGVSVASIEVVQNKEGKWITGQMGGFRTARAVFSITDRILKNDTAVAKDKIRLVHSGAHGLLFVSFQKGGQAWLAAVNARPDAGFRGGEVLPEKTVLQRLRDIYKQIDPNLPD